jgi:GT2 family glycosyltransferase
MSFTGPIFICGTSRSGTSLLQAALEKNPRVQIAGETHYFDDLRVALGEQALGARLEGAEQRRVEDYLLALSHRPFGHEGDPEQGWMKREALRARALALVGLARLRPGAAKLNVSRPQSVPVLTGAFMMIRTSTWRRLGGFDEQFFMYAEEVDLCKRIADGGGGLLCDPRIRMLHDTGSGERRTPTRFLNRARGNATFYRKHFGPFWATACSALLYAHALSRATWGRLAGKRAHADSFGALVRHPSDWWHGWPPPKPPVEAS